MKAKRLLVCRQTRSKRFSLWPTTAIGPVTGQQIAKGFGPLGGQIRQIHAKQFLRHRVERIVGQEMDALHENVLRQNQIMAGSRWQDGHVIGQVSRVDRMGKRPEQPFDGLELAGEIDGGQRLALGPNVARDTIQGRIDELGLGLIEKGLGQFDVFVDDDLSRDLRTLH